MADLKSALSEVSRLLGDAEACDKPFHIRLHHERPCYAVESLRPLVYREYGEFIHKGPKLLGVFAVSGLMWQEVEDQYYTYAVVRSESPLSYGVNIGVPLLNEAAEFVAYPVRFVPRDNSLRVE